MELTKNDNQMAKGIAILGMLMLHLFCRVGALPYEPQVYVKGQPLIYYFGVFGDLCVPIYCFCSGYAQMVLREKEQDAYFRHSAVRLIKFLLNYWIVLIIFSVIGLFFDKTGYIPGSLGSFLGNLLLFRLSYNGAWWFVLTYIFLLSLSPMMMNLVQRFSIWTIFICSGIIYFISYLLRFVYKLEISNPFCLWFYTQLILIGTSQFSFLIGMLFKKYQFISKLRCVRLSHWLRNVCCILIPIAMFLFHAVVKSPIISPITGLITIVCFHTMDKPNWICRVALFFGKHSTNIWLIHMFFYLFLFKDFIFIAKYPLLILSLMLAICIVVSYGINLFYQPAVRLICRKEFSCKKSV